MNKNLKTIILVLIIILILLIQFKADEIIGLLTSQKTYNYDTEVTVGDQRVTVEIVDEKNEIIQGLSGRKTLPQDKGMLFIFPITQEVGFWMPDMYFPLDMIFIRDKKIVHIEKDVPNPSLDTPKSELPTYLSGQPIDMVLEVNAGWSENNEIKVGDEIKL